MLTEGNSKQEREGRRKRDGDGGREGDLARIEARFALLTMLVICLNHESIASSRPPKLMTNKR